jgi:hypothetical protein
MVNGYQLVNIKESEATMSPQLTRQRQERQPLFEGVLFIIILAILIATLKYVSALTAPAFRAMSTSPLPTPTSSSPLPTPRPTLNILVATKQAINVTEEARPTHALTPQPTVLKPVPTSIEFATPEPTAFAPISESIPAGAGALVQVAPPFSGSQYHIENDWW